MTSSVGVILAHDDRALAEQITEALERLPDLFVAGTSLDAGAGSVVVAGGEQLARMSTHERPIVAIATDDLVRAARAALAVRAADIVRWPDEATRLPAAIRRAAAGAHRAVSRGRTVAVVSARGGTGASTLAALLASSLDALVLDLTGGQRAFAPDEGVRTLDELRVPIADVTADQLEPLVSAHPAGRAVYARQFAEPVSLGGAHALMRAARDLGPVTVVDTGTCAHPGVRAAAADADARILVCADDIASVRAAKLLRALLQDDVLVVVRRRRRGGIAMRDLQAALGDLVAVIREDSAVARATDLGKLPSRPTSTRRAADRLAARLQERWA